MHTKVAPHSCSLRKADLGNRCGRDKGRVALTPSYLQMSMKSPQQTEACWDMREMEEVEVIRRLNVSKRDDKKIEF